MSTEAALPRIKERTSVKRYRRFTTRSALRSRDRRSSGKKSDVPKLNLPELDSGEAGLEVKFLVFISILFINYTAFIIHIGIITHSLSRNLTSRNIELTDQNVALMFI